MNAMHKPIVGASNFDRGTTPAEASIAYQGIVADYHRMAEGCAMGGSEDLACACLRLAAQHTANAIGWCSR
jgi:hypothetical protein